MKFCFIAASSIPIKDETAPSISVGVFSLANLLKEKGHKTTIVDLFLSFKNRKNFQPSLFYKKSIQLIKAEKADAFCFSVDCYSFPLLVKISQLLKRIYPFKPIIFGGPHTFSIDGQIMKAFPFIDFILRGETDETLPFLASALSKKEGFPQIPGLTWRDEKGKIIRNQDSSPVKDLNSIPFPDYRIKPSLNSYIKEGLDYIRIESGRGCPFNCAFCSTSLFFSRKVRLRDPQKILSHIRQIKRNYGLKEILFAHDNVTTNKKYIEQFCKILSKEKTISWICGGRLEDFNYKMLKMLKKGHCSRIEIGIESGSEKIQKEIHKNLNLNELFPTLKLANKIGIKIALSFILGFPSETERDINKTLMMVLFSAILGAIINLNKLVPLPGTELISIYRDKLLFSGKNPLLTYPIYKRVLPIIKKSSLIFSAFYEYQTEYASPRVLYQLEEIYPYIVKYFPFSFFLLSKKIAPFEIFRRFLLNWKYKKFSSPKNFIKKFYIYLCGLYKEMKIEYAFPILEYEYLIAKNKISFLSEKKDFRLQQYREIKRMHSVDDLLNAVPYISKKAFISACHFNIAHVFKNAKKNPKSLWNIKFSNKIKIFLTLVLPDKEPHTINLDKKKELCFSLINGKRTIREIIQKIALSFPKKKALGVEVGKIFIELFKGGFLGISSRALLSRKRTCKFPSPNRNFQHF